MAETHGQDIRPGIQPAFPPAAGSDGQKFQSLFWSNACIITIFLLLSAGGGYSLDNYLEKNDSIYTTSGKVRLLPLPLPGGFQPTVEDAKSLEIEQTTESMRFRSESLLDDILKDQDNQIRLTNWWNVTCGKDPDKAHKLLDQNLVVDLIPGSQLMKISLSTPNKDDTALLITTLVERAIRDQQDFIRNKNDADRKRTADLRTRYEIELRRTTADVRTMIEELTQLGANPIGLGSASENGGIASPEDTEINAQVQQRVEFQAAKFDIDNSVAELTKMKEQNQVPPLVQHMIDDDPDVINAKIALDNIGKQLNDAQGQSGPSTAAFEQLTKEQELGHKKLDDLKAQKLTQYLDTYSAQMMSSKKAIDDKLAHCNSEILRLETELAEIANKTLALRDREQAVAAFRQGYIQYDKMMQDLDALPRGDLAGGLVWFERPHTPTTRIFPNINVIMTTAIGLGLMLGVGIAVLRAIIK